MVIAGVETTRSVEDFIPTQSVGTRHPDWNLVAISCQIRQPAAGNTAVAVTTGW